MLDAIPEDEEVQYAIPEDEEVQPIIQEARIRLEKLQLKKLHNEFISLKINSDLQSELGKIYDTLTMLLTVESGAQLSPQSQLGELNQLYQEKIQALNQYMQIANQLYSAVQNEVENEKKIQIIKSMENVDQLFELNFFVSLQVNNSSPELTHVDKGDDDELAKINDDSTPELIRTNSEEDVRNNPQVDMIAVQQQSAVILADPAVDSKSPNCFKRIIGRIWGERNSAESVESVNPSSKLENKDSLHIRKCT